MMDMSNFTVIGQDLGRYFENAAGDRFLPANILNNINA
jgi:hypothetical protein